LKSVQLWKRIPAFAFVDQERPCLGSQAQLTQEPVTKFNLTFAPSSGKSGKPYDAVEQVRMAASANWAKTKSLIHH
jgi:hypothetical protein